MVPVIYELANIIPLAMSASLFLFAKQTGSAALWILPVLIPAFFVLLLHMKNRVRLGAGGVLICLAAGVFIISSRETRRVFFESHGWMIPPVLLSIAVFLFEEAALRHRKLKLIPVAGLVSSLLYMMFAQIPAGMIQVSVSLFYLLVTASEEVEIRWKKEGKGTLPQAVTRILPFPLGVLIILMLLKAPAKPYDWAFVKKAVKNARAACELVIGSFDRNKGWDGDEAVMGFSDEGGIKSGIRSRSYPAMSVTVDKRIDGRFYLSGRTFDSFDGREWKKTDDDETDGRTYDVLLTRAALDKYDPERPGDYIRSIYTTVKYEGIRTELLFVPPKVLPFAMDEMPYERGGDLLSAGKKRRSYKSAGYNINGENEDLQAFLEADIKIDKEDFNGARLRLLGKKEQGYTFEGLTEYGEHVFEVYGKDPGLSPAVRSYLDEIIEGTESDTEKLRAIEAALSKMRYDTNPGRLPDDIQSSTEFLELFLLERKAGYCVHYATAFVLLSRALGIPARYVQGYSVKMNGRQAQVMSDDAHAWPEVYLKDKGWMIFEPTPGFRAVSGWSTSAANGGGKAYGSDMAERYGSEVSEGSVADVAGTWGVKKRFDPGKLVLPLLFVLIFVIVFIMADIFIRRYRYSRMDEKERILSNGERSLKLLKKCGIVRKSGETVTELRLRAGERIPQEMLSFLEIYEKALYSAQCPCMKDVTCVENGCGELAKHIRRQRLAKLFRKRVV